MLETLLSSAGGSASSWGATIPHTSWLKKNQNIQQKQPCNKFNKDFKKWSMSKEIFKKRKLLLTPE